MTRKSKREIENALDRLTPSSTPAATCSDCGGAAEGFDAAAGVTAPFVSYECDCECEVPT